MTLRRHGPRQRGFSMLEVLIAVLVFSFGMLGLAGLLIFAIQSNHVAYLRTQATFLAHNMAARMGNNPAAVWAGDYNQAVAAAGTPVTSCDAGCDPAALATHDIQAWSQQLHTFLPLADGAIECEVKNANYTPTAVQYNLRPPYSGTCTMTIVWNEASARTGVRNLHTFAWRFQP